MRRAFVEGIERNDRNSGLFREGAQALTVAATDNTPMIRDARLDEYLSAHRQSATNGMVVPYLRAVANGVANTQDSNQE